MRKSGGIPWKNIGDTKFTNAEELAWENNEVRIGFELHYQDEEDEAEARKTLLPLLEFLFQMGFRIRNA